MEERISRKRKLSAATSASAQSQTAQEHQEAKSSPEEILVQRAARRVRNVADAAVLGLVKSKTPSLVLVEQEESRLVRLARSRINRFLRVCIAKFKKLPCDITYASPSSPQQRRYSSDSFSSWLPQLMVASHSDTLRVRTVEFYMNVVRRAGNEWDAVEQAFFLFMRTMQIDGLSPLTEALAQVKSKDIWRRAAKIGVLRSCNTKLGSIVKILVERELKIQEPCADTVKMLRALVLMIENLTSNAPNQASDLQLIVAVAVLQALQLGSIHIDGIVKQLRKISEELSKSPDCVVKETGKALVEFVPLLSKTYSRCSLYVVALKVLLTDVMNAVVPKHKVPDIALQLQRAPTQDEYFRSGLPKSNLTLKEIPCANKENPSPLVSDLKAKIANDLGMASSLEMFELVCANKILGPDLELTRVFDQIWRPHVSSRTRPLITTSRRRLARADAMMGRAGSSRYASARAMSDPRSLIMQLQDSHRIRYSGEEHGNRMGDVLFRTLRGRIAGLEDGVTVTMGRGAMRALAVPTFIEDDEEDDGEQGSDTGLQLQSMIVEDNEEDDEDEEENNEEDDTRHHANRAMVTVVPAMLITYRLCAVDGEATEDFVGTLQSSAQDVKQEFFASTVEYGDGGLRSLVQLVSVCCDNLKTWPSSAARDLLSLTLGALDHAVNVNGGALVKMGALPVLLRCLVDLGESPTSGVCLSVIDRLVSGENVEFEENAFEYSSTERDLSHQDGGDQLDWVLERLDSFAHKPKLLNALSRLVPHLIYGRHDKARQLAEELISKKDKPWSLLVIENLSTSSDALLLRDALYDLGLQQKCVEQLNQSSTAAFLEHAALPETQLSLRMLRGLVKGHQSSAALVCDSPCIYTIVKMEEISSTKVEQVGANAFAVLEALSAPTSAPAIRDAVTRVQKQRQDEIRAMTLKKRSKAMKNLNAKQPQEASASAASSKKQKRWMDELKTLEDEDSSIVCIVCHEGYKSKPNQLMCVYTHQKAVPLHHGASFIGTNGAVRRATHNSNYCICSSSSFVFIHQACHESAARADRSHPKAPKDEWEGAELRNGHVKCNNLMPLKGAVLRPVYHAALHAFFERADRDPRVKLSSGGPTDPSLFSVVSHDLRILLLRACFGESFSEDTRGGSLESNLKLVVPLLQMGRALLGPETRSSAETVLASFMSGPSDAGSSNSIDWAFACILSLFLLNDAAWEEHRTTILLPGISAHVLALSTSAANGDLASIGSGALSSAKAANITVVGGGTMGRAKSRSRARSLSVSAESAMEEIKDDVVPAVFRPWLCYFALVDELKRTQKEDLPDAEAVALANTLADKTKSLLTASSSIPAIAKVLTVEPETLRTILAASRSRSQSVASVSAKQSGS